jgi:hypothetical protein
MDLLDFDPEPLYFDDPLAPEVDALLRAAAESYGEGQAEPHLMRAYFLAPRQPTVLVALYRYFYYRHRLTETTWKRFPCRTRWTSSLRRKSSSITSQFATTRR